MLIFALALAACSTEREQATSQPTAAPQATALAVTPASQAPSGAVPLNAIAASPDAFAGKRVTVQGNIAQMVGQRAFTLADQAGDTRLLVVMAEPDATIPVGEAVVLTGDVSSFELNAVERASSVDLQPDLFAEYAGQPVIVAQSLNLAVPAAGIPDPGSNAGSTASAGISVTLDEIGDNPGAYYGKTVTLEAAIAQIVGLNAFTLNEPGALSDDNLLVVTPQQGIPAGTGERVEVTGAVREFDLAAIEGDTGLDLQDDLLSAYDGRAVVIASAIEPVQ
jgi:hypothetical protein